jgi:hypothetical protein
VELLASLERLLHGIVVVVVGGGGGGVVVVVVAAAADFTLCYIPLSHAPS